MEVATYRIATLPNTALDAARVFHADHLPAIQRAVAGADVLVIIFPAAEHDQRVWRSACVADLARAYAPARVNAVAGDDDGAMREAVDYLAAAPGVTGQYFAVDDSSICDAVE